MTKKSSKRTKSSKRSGSKVQVTDFFRGSGEARKELLAQPEDEYARCPCDTCGPESSLIISTGKNGPL